MDISLATLMSPIMWATKTLNHSASALAHFRTHWITGQKVYTPLDWWGSQGWTNNFSVQITVEFFKTTILKRLGFTFSLYFCLFAYFSWFVMSTILFCSPHIRV